MPKNIVFGQAGGGDTQLAIIMICNIILFILTANLLVNEICKLIGIENYLKAFISFLMLFSILGFKAWTEIFYWFSGAVSYSFPLVAAMLAVTLYLKHKNIYIYIVACILTFLASGGSLEVAGFSCFGILTILFVKGRQNLQKKDLIFFTIAVLGALINTAAPGNFIRRNVIDNTGLHIKAAIIYSVNQVIRSMEYLLYQTPFFSIIIICIILGIFIGGGKWFYKILAYKIVIMCAAMPFITCFPVSLAYINDAGCNFPNRCEFVCIFVIIMVTIIISILTGIFIKEMKKEEYIKVYQILTIALLILCIIMPIINENYRYSNTVIYRMYENEATDSFRRYHKNVMKIYNEIKESKNQEVVVENLPQAVSDFLNINTSILVNPYDWRNQAIAQYYKKNSVVLKSQE